MLIQVEIQTQIQIQIPIQTLDSRYKIPDIRYYIDFHADSFTGSLFPLLTALIHSPCAMIVLLYSSCAFGCLWLLGVNWLLALTCSSLARRASWYISAVLFSMLVSVLFWVVV